MGDTYKGMQARLLLVHSPLVGCGTWEPIARDLAGDGYAVTVPDLAGTVTAAPPYHLRQAQVIAGSAAGQPAILIGHSGAGALLATAGTMLGEGARGYIFVDAGPTSGRAAISIVSVLVAQRSWIRLAPRDMAFDHGQGGVSCSSARLLVPGGRG
jgi:pimeloyl-ACP methyl ester carboxylesterase